MTVTDDTVGVRVPNPGQALVEIPSTLEKPLLLWKQHEADVLKFQRQAAAARAAFAEAKDRLKLAERQLASARENAAYALKELHAAMKDHRQ